ncbi:RNA methyltransferase [bacterium]|nr:RNA methyltransferase [bacterium]
MKELTSLNNELVKFVSSLSIKKFRDTNNLFIVEGEKALEGALNNGFNLKYVFTLSEKDFNIKDDILYKVNEKVMRKISTTESLPPVLSVVEKKNFVLNKKSSKILLLENIKDNGNLGTIIRSACAFNIDLIILLGDCCDLYSPKTIRSSAGTFFQMPFIEYKSISEVRSDFKDFKFISTNLHKKSDILLSEIKGNYVIMFGSEAEGLSENTTKSADNNFILPINSSVESLNLSTAVSLVLYELSKTF